MRPAIFVARIAVAFLFLAGFVRVAAQTTSEVTPQKGQDPLDRDSPQSSVFSFLEACRAKNYARAWRYLDLRGVSENKRSDDGPQLARQLEQVLDPRSAI